MIFMVSVIFFIYFKTKISLVQPRTKSNPKGIKGGSDGW